MISVITPLYRTPADVLARTWASLRRQTHTDWEWVVYDDSPDGEWDAWRQVYGFCADDRYRIRLLPREPHCGSIGAVKQRAFMAAAGAVLVELDHDDELTPDAIAAIAAAFTDPAVGFVYSDWQEINGDGWSCRYPEGWAFGYGSDYLLPDGTWAMRAPELNAVTLSHIVSAPNHVRAWSEDVYRAIGGHDPSLEVADDYDLVVRTALATTCRHIPRMLYRQHIGGHTAQRQRNAAIQKHVATISARYAEAIAARYGSAPTSGR